MKKFWKIVGIATLVAVLGITAVGAVAFAQDSEDGADWPFNFRERMHEAIAGVLGISIDEYDAAIETAQDQVIDEAVAEGWLTEDQAEQMRERAAQRGEEGFGPGMQPGRQGGKFGGRGGFTRGPENSFLSIAAEAFDMTPQELRTELQDGKSIADVAADKGVDTQTIVDAYLAQLKETLDQAVADGKITQARADWMLEQAGTHVTDMLDQNWEGRGPGGRPGGFGPGMHPGGFQGFPGQTGA